MNKKYLYGALVALWLCWMWNSAYNGIFPTVMPVVRDSLLLSPSKMSIILSLIGWGNGIGRLICGFISKWMGMKKSIILGVITSIIFIFLFTLSKSYYFALIMAFMAGLSLGIYSPAAISLLVDMFKGRSGFFVSLHETAAPVGATIGPIFIGAMMSIGMGWQSGVLFWLIPAALAIILILLLVKEPQKQALPMPVEDKKAATPVSEVKLPDLTKRAPVPVWVIVMLIAGAVGAMVQLGIMTLLVPLTIIDKFKLTVAQLGFITGTASIFGVAGQLGAGWLSDRIGRVPVLVLSPILVSIVILGLAFCPWGALFYVALALTNMFSNAYMPVFFVTAGELFHLDTRGKMLGIIQFCTFSFANLNLIIMGKILEDKNMAASYYYAVALLLFGSTVNFVLYRLYFKKRKVLV
jgi:MFS family permease